MIKMKSILVNSLSKTVLFLGVIVIFACKNYKKTGIEGDNNDGNKVVIGDNNVVINDNNRRVFEKVDIVGAWDEAKARHLTSSILTEDSAKKTEKYVHTIMGFYNIDYIDRESIIAVAYSQKEEYGGVLECHFCGVLMTFIEFDKYDNGWVIRNKYVRVLEQGTWGEPPSDWKLMNIGYNKFGFVVEASFGNQGFFESNYYIYTFLGDQFKEIGIIPSSDDDGGAKSVSENSFKSKIEIIKEGTGFYDLKVTTNGVKGFKQFNKTEYYKFDGIKYSINSNFN